MLRSRWSTRVAVADREMHEAMNQVRLRVVAEVIRQLNELIYSKPEDVGPSGRKRWERTGRLKAEEFASLEENGPNGSIRVVLVNHMPYAEPRHEANKPGRRKINPYRTAHWRDATVEKLRPWVVNRLRQANQAWIASGGTEEETG